MAADAVTERRSKKMGDGAKDAGGWRGGARF